MSDQVQLFEVSLRDGLQNEAVVVPTADKLRLLDALVASGLRDIEVSSFVRPSRVPALADAADLFAALPTDTDVRFWALVPNPKGMDRALAAGVKHVCTFLSSSETHNRKNVNRTIRESVAGLRRVIETARDEGLTVRAYVSTAFGCPYEGDVPEAKVVDLTMQMLDMGADVVALGDTTGMGLPDQVTSMVRALDDAGVPLDKVALHAHDTRGTALVNVYAAWQAGLRRFDGSVAGIGGCPYAPGAAGNVGTEDLVHLFEGMGIDTGVDLDVLARAGRDIAGVLGRDLPGRVHRAMIGEGQRDAARRSA